MQSGQGYGPLCPIYAIGLLGEDRRRDDRGRPLLDHGGISLFALNTFAAERVETEQERWLKFFRDGERLDDTALPVWMQTAEMRQAMSTLKAFSEKERADHAYQARQNFLREQQSIRSAREDARAARAAAEREKEAERQAKEAALQAQEAERQAKDEALAEVERLKALLQGQGTVR